MKRAVLLLSALGLLLCAYGCKSSSKKPGAGHEDAATHGEDAGRAQRSEERAVLSRVAIDTIDPAVRREIHARELAHAIGEQLLSSQWFYLPGDELPEGAHGRRGVLEVVVTYDVISDPESDSRSIMVAIEAEVAWEERGALPLRDKVLFQRTLEPPDVAADELDDLVAAQAGLAAEAVGKGLLAKEEIRSGPDAAAALALGNAESDPDLALWALEVVRTQKRAGLFEQVVGLLDAKDSDLRETAVGVLLALEDRRAVKYLTEKAEMGDRTHLFAVIEAVSTLGGEEAVDFLEFVASGHPDSEVRARAQAGLERIERGSPRER